MRRQPPLTTTTAGGSRRRRGVLASVAVSTLALGVLAAVPAQAAPITVDVYGINDFHGRLERGAAPRPGEQGVAGAAALAGLLTQYRTANPNTVFVSSGDNIGASTFTSFIQDDAPTLTALDQMGLDVSAIGNHEFDRGQDDLSGRVEDAADFDYLAANVVDAATGEAAFDAYSIEERAGKKIAFIGAVTELMPELVSPAGIEGLEFTDIADSVNEYATALTNGQPDALTGDDEADAVVLLVHEGGSTAAAPEAGDGSAWSDIVYGVTPEVDAILSAHTHQLYDYAVVPTGGTTPRPVIQTGSYGGALSHLALTFDSDDVTVKSVASRGTIDLYGATSGADFVPDADVQRTVDEAVAFAATEGARPVGTISAPFLRAVQSDGDTENRGGESTVGNLVADVQLAATEANGAQMAFMNPGGLRADLTGGEGGVVTYQQAAAVQPFANTLVVADMTGAEVKAALEQQWQPAGSSRPFLKLGASKGVAYTYDPAAAPGEHLTSLTLDGVPVDPATTYKVTVNSFLASGGDNFGAFATDVQADSGTVDLQAQVDYFQGVEGAVGPDLGQRAVGITSPDEVGTEGYQVGETITIDLSSLTFSDATGPDVLDVALGGDALGQVPLDRTVVDTTDEQGRARLQLEVVADAAPADEVGVAALRELQVTVPGTDTVVTIAADVPEGVSLVLANALPPVVDPAPTDPADPGTPAPGTPAPGTPAPGTPGTGTGTGGTGTAASQGPLAYTGSELASGGLLAALALLLAGAGVLTATRLRRRAGTTAEGTPTD